ncbi:MAG TPA: MFS transporter, partial [Novosphingobium sp.]|nr:MFS transporter [Novosphingobium sp.]
TWEPAEENAASEADHAPHHASWAHFPLARFVPVLLVTIYSSVFFYTVQIQASVGLAQLGLTDPARIGFLTSIASVGVPLGTVVYSRSGLKDPRWLLLIEMVMLCTGFLVMARAQGPTPFLVGCFINQLGAGMLLPTLLVWAMGLLAFEVRGRGSGLWQGALAVGQFLCPVVVTYLANRFGGLFAAFGCLAVGAGAGAVVALATLAWQRKPAAA